MAAAFISLELFFTHKAIGPIAICVSILVNIHWTLAQSENIYLKGDHFNIELNYNMHIFYGISNGKKALSF